jgi:two-component system phosphate regulon response regulator PhoB
MTCTILVIEDEPNILEVIVFALEKNGFNVLQATNYGEAKDLLHQEPALVLVDWMLPGGSGIKITREIKRNEKTRNTPVIMVTARADENDKVMGFEAGVDDYITKPFSLKELVARVKVGIRRAVGETLEDRLQINELSLDPVSHRVTINAETIKLGPTEFKMLHFFMSHPERVFSREQLLDNIWGTNVYVEDRTIDVHIRRLRHSIRAQEHDKFIQTVRGVGYRFSTQV